MLQRAFELIMIRHGVDEAALYDSFTPSRTIKALSALPGMKSKVAEIIEEAILRHSTEPKEGTFDDAEFLLNVAKAEG